MKTAYFLLAMLALGGWECRLVGVVPAARRNTKCTACENTVTFHNS